MGVRWVIIGTAALRDPGFVRKACREFPDQVILGIDAGGGRLAVQGWTETQAETAVALARRFAEDRPAALVYTDIARDGMQTGVNIESTRELAESDGIPVIASGGVSGIRDIEKLMTMEKQGVFGVIAGKALYTGALSLAEAIACTKGRRECGNASEHEMGRGFNEARSSRDEGGMEHGGLHILQNRGRRDSLPEGV